MLDWLAPETKLDYRIGLLCSKILGARIVEDRHLIVCESVE